MSGSGRKSQYRKSVTSSFLDKKNGEYLPSGAEVIGMVKGNRGGNLFDVQIPLTATNEETVFTEVRKQACQGEVILAKLPNKFNKLLWIKANDYVVVEKEAFESGDSDITSNPSTENPNPSTGKNTDLSGYCIKHILSKENVKYLKSQTAWPVIFSESSSSEDGKYGKKKQVNITSYGNDDIMPGYCEDDNESDDDAKNNEEDEPMKAKDNEEDEPIQDSIISSSTSLIS